MQYKRLFEPFKLGKMQLKNRIVMPPMSTRFATDEGFVSQRLIDYYVARARGGVGLIIVEVAAPNIKCQNPGQLSLGGDGYIPGFRKLANAVHKYGAKIAVQLQHSGFEYRGDERIQVAPSPVIVPTTLNVIPGKIPYELKIEEIERIIEWFAIAAGRAKEAGLDGVEIHGAHNYLIASFLSSANRRTDKYGGSVENKARFLIEIIRAMKKVVGPDFPIWPRINAREWGRENGITIEEAKMVAQMAADAGAIAINVSGAGTGRYVTTAPITDTPGILLPLSAEVKKVVRVPVIVAGRLDAELGEKALEEGKADLIAIGRRIFAEPEYTNKIAAGRIEDINPCICCMECIERLMSSGKGAPCAVNAATGRESEYQLSPAKKAKKVVVVGGGPAGMEAARVAALRGHKVLLLEKESQLGGRLNVAALPPHKGDIIPMIKYLIRQIGKAGVEVRVNTTATPEVISKEKPDVVIIASGGEPLVPAIKGIDKSDAVFAEDALSGKAAVGQSVLIVGGGMVGCETGHYLAEKGKMVTIVEMLKEVAGDMFPRLRWRLLDGLAEKKVTIITSCTCEEITKNSVTFTTGEGRKTVLVDTVVLAAGYKINDTLYRELEGKYPEVYSIGDALQVRRILDAINDGYRIGLML